MSRVIVPVILSGGSGTRLWPLSRADRPKQFLRLVTNRTMFQDTLLRVRQLPYRDVGEPIVVCNEAHRFLVAEQLRELGTQARAIVLEPEGRNTAPAVAVAAMIAARSARAGERTTLLVLPADHVMTDTAAFAEAVDAALQAAEAGDLVAFGVVPDRAETGYGYIRRGASRGRWYALQQFVEKPDRATAEQYAASGEYLWNSGMFVFTAEAYLRETSEHAPEILEACREAVAEAVVDSDFVRLGPAFARCPSDSIDYALMEKTSKAAVVPLAAGWSDVGSWAALHEVLEKDGEGNARRGDVVLHACRDSYVCASTRRVVSVGLDGCVIVETADAVLVLAKGSSQELKAVVEAVNGPGARTGSDPHK